MASLEAHWIYKVVARKCAYCTIWFTVGGPAASGMVNAGRAAAFDV